MTRTWKTCGLSTLTVLVLLTRVSAGGAGEKPPPDPDPIKKIEKQVEEIAARGKGLADQITKAFKQFGEDLKSIDSRLKALEGKEADAGLRLTDAEQKLAKHKEQIVNLEKIIEKLRDDVEELRRRLPEGRIAKSLDPERADLKDLLTRVQRLEQEVERLSAGGSGRIARSAPNTGRVVFMNRYPQELLFILNGQAQRVLPNTQQIFGNVPAGTFTYEVIVDGGGSGGRQTRTLAPGETFTITAR
jgi:hypothetical protein